MATRRQQSAKYRRPKSGQRQVGAPPRLAKGRRLGILCIGFGLAISSACAPVRSFSDDRPAEAREGGAQAPSGETTSGLPRLELLAPGFGLSCGTSVSADGSVVVGYLADTPRSMIQPFRWSEADGVVTLTNNDETLDYGNALAVSADGTVVAGYASLLSRPGAFRWTESSGVTMVGADDDAALSGDGSILVGRDSSPTDGTHLFRWTATTGALDLGRLGAGAQVNALSGDGTTVAGSFDETVGGSSHAFLWTSGEGVVQIGPSDVASNANAVSGDGGVAVGAYASQDGSYEIAFRWDRENGLVDLDLDGLSDTTAVAIARDGSTIVGTAPHDSWIWSKIGGTRLLAAVLAEKGIDVSALSQFEAAGVSDDGAVITGCVRDATLTTRAFIARLGD